MSASLHTRIALALRWSLTDVRSFSLLTLRDIVKHADPSLAEEISRMLLAGTHLIRRTEGDSP